MPQMEGKKRKAKSSVTDINTIKTTTTNTHKTPHKNTNTKIITHFSLTLASLKNPHHPLSKTHLLNSSKILLSSLKPSPSSSLSLSSSHVSMILSLIPSLLCSNYHQLVCTAVRILGAASLLSIDINQRVALDVGILKGLTLNVLRVDKISVKKSVCNAVLDVCVTSLGCQMLLGVSSLTYLLLGFLQVQNSISTTLRVKVIKYDIGIFLGVDCYEDEILLLLLNAAATLTNICNYEQLKNIPRRLKEAILSYMIEIWSKVHEQLLTSKHLNISEGKCYYRTNLTVPNLAECIFRLSMDVPSVTYSIPSDVIIKQIFGPAPASFESFISGHWESFPFLIRSQPKDVETPVLFSSFMHSLTCEEALPGFISSILRGMVSCPPVALNEIDILNFLNDVRQTLGSPLIHQQDIRVVRTTLHSKGEEHYFKESSSHDIDVRRSFSRDDILKCKAAYEEGYTIALRGLEFRFNSISEVARQIASIFGQPSVGANLYITPPNSQGLSCHYDDHCVFVCQLYGGKQWAVSPEPIIKLPRLFESLEVPEGSLVESKQVFLREGDILYIPRGFSHKANTATDPHAKSKACNSSVHLTLAIEVEPPFEWEGFAHVALHQWSNNIGPNTFPCDTSRILLGVSVNILHVSFRLISNTETVFRKACLVASSSLPSESNYWLDKNQRDTFDLIIDKINKLSSFTDSVNFLQTSIQRDDDPFHWLRWLEHLNGRESFIRDDCNFTLDGICKFLPFICQHKDDAEATFTLVKSKFCDEVLFDYVKESFVRFTAKYKEARMQYMNGMLSLHC